MSPMAKMRGSLVSNLAVSTGIRFSWRLRPQSATGPSFMVRPKKGSMTLGRLLEGRPVGVLDGDAR